MPVSPKRSGDSQGRAAESTRPAGLRPYLHHGVMLDVRGGHGVSDCPFCGRDGKFSVDVDTGLWRCWSCGGGQPKGGGNALAFLRALHALAALGRAGDGAVAADRRLADPGTPAAWGVHPSPVPPHPWLVPGYAPDGRLDQLYVRTWVPDSRGGSHRLLPTPDVWPAGRAHAWHAPHAAGDWLPDRPRMYVCEGPWDGMAMWEAARACGALEDANVVAVPGCNVWRDEWTEACAGKHVVLMYDSDHPRVNGAYTSRPGSDGMRRVAGRVCGRAASVRYLRWGPEGYDPARPSGWDVRDSLTGPSGTSPTPTAMRGAALAEVLSMVTDVPPEWSTLTSPSEARHPGVAVVESMSCSSWAECLGAWQQALRWRQDMSDALAVLLAVCASTQQGGNQLFLQLVGSAGSGKTTLCEGLLVSRHCHHLEHLTGFHSGYKVEGGGDCSLIARINGKTLITPEADVLLSSPHFAKIMGEQRRIFDGKSGATFKNAETDSLHVGLRTPWIMAGTPAMLDHDQSHLGDRFLRFMIDDPDEYEKRLILKSALRSERVAMMDVANGTAGSLVDPLTRRAHALTGGYVDWLRANVEELLVAVNSSMSESAEDRCIDLAELSADLRARPNEDRHKVEVHDTKELPTRLARQNVRLAAHLAVVLNKRTVDADVLRIVRKCALDTAYGHSLNVVRWLCAVNPRGGGLSYQETGGLGEGALATWAGMTPDRLGKYAAFLRKVGVLEWRGQASGGAWVLTQRAHDLYLRVMEG